MSVPHSAIKQASFLRQALSQGKSPLGLFIGAGCPGAIKDSTGNPLIPDIAGLTKIVSEEMKDANYQIITTHLVSDGKSTFTIEEVLTYIRSLREVVGSGTVKNLNASHLEKLDKDICDLIYKYTQKVLPTTNSAYHKIAAWIGAIYRESEVEIFTSNYDLLMEQALEENRIAYFDGFVGSRKPFFDVHAIEEDKLPARWARLWKLHGSINWNMEKDQVSRGEASEKAGQRVIHPSHLKYKESRKMPYLAMFDRLKIYLKKKNCVLVTCGYSFNDEHINEVLEQGIQGNSTGAIFALLFGKLDSYSKAKDIAARHANLSLFAEDKAVIGTKCDNWDTSKENVELGPEIELIKDESQSDCWNIKFRIVDFSNFGIFIEDLIGNKNTDQSKTSE